MLQMAVCTSLCACHIYASIECRSFEWSATIRLYCQQCYYSRISAVCAHLWVLRFSCDPHCCRYLLAARRLRSIASFLANFTHFVALGFAWLWFCCIVLLIFRFLLFFFFCQSYCCILAVAWCAVLAHHLASVLPAKHR